MPYFVSNSLYDIIGQYARALSVPVDALVRIIFFESGFNPQAKNPNSSARGLIQFTDSTARSLGFNDSLDLVTRLPSIESQLTAIYNYLVKNHCTGVAENVYLGIFYPAALSWPLSQKFPENVTAVNPGIYTPADYIDKVNKVKILRLTNGYFVYTEILEKATLASIAAAVAFLYSFSH